MKNAIISLLLTLVTCFSFGQSPSFAVFEPDEYAMRRSLFMEKIPDGIAVIQGAVQRTDYYRFFQNNDFMYLCGLEIPDAVLVIDGVNKESSVFFTINDRGARNFGIPLEHVNNTLEVTGLEAHYGIEELERFLKKKAKTINVFYTEFSPEELMRECSNEKARYEKARMVNNPRDGRPTREQQFVFYLKNILPETVLVTDCSEKIWDLRVIKSPAEIALMRKAGRIGVEAHKELMKATYVGQPEYELAAVFEFANKKRGAQELAYSTIICADENHPYLHYHTYDGILADGDFLVIDGGPDLH